jgi:hypothetical protein
LFRLVRYIPQSDRLEDTILKGICCSGNCSSSGFYSRGNVCQCTRCLGNVFSFLDNTLISSLAIGRYRNNAYKAVARQWTSLYALSRKRVLKSRCLAMDVRSDILAFRRHTTIF